MTVIKDFEKNLGLEIDVLTQKREEKPTDGSPVAFIANHVIEKARAVQRDFATRYGISSTIHEDTATRLYRSLPEEEKILFRRSAEAIPLFTLLIELEQSIVEGKFLAKNFTDRYNNAISGTLLYTWDKPKTDVEILSDEKKGRMMQRAKSDLSFASFFEKDGLNDLPETVLNILLELGIIPDVQNHFLKPYIQTYNAVAEIKRADYSMQAKPQRP